MPVCNNSAPAAVVRATGIPSTAGTVNPKEKVVLELDDRAG